MSKPLGRELLLDGYHCQHDLMVDVGVAHDFLIRAVAALEVRPLSPPFVFRAPEADGPDPKMLGGGVSGWICLIESGIQIHLFTPKDFLSVDFYTCGRLDDKMSKALMDLVREVYHPTDVEIEIINRGMRYYEK